MELNHSYIMHANINSKFSLNKLNDHDDINSVDVNECLTSPCQNGGTCLNMAGSYSCACAQGWKGKNCTEGMSYQSFF